MIKKIYIKLRPMYWAIRWELMRTICCVVGCNIGYDYKDRYAYCFRCGAVIPKTKFNWYQPFDTFIEKE